MVSAAKGAPVGVEHIVLIRWATEDDVLREEVRAAIRGLPQAIPLIESLREGESISPEGLESGFEYGFVITFPSAVARDTYLDHPAHLPVADRIRSAAEDVLVFDIET